ncbi:MAG: YraN family protein [Deltaproteobacteria bacterium]|nr:YraN family protein [Deltaproteobacteria bacterium]
MSRKIGSEAENLVAAYLKNKGFQILEQNWSCRRGEIDLIASKLSKLYFVEVKFRSSNQFGSGLESLTPSKLKKIAGAALFYLQQNKKEKNDFSFAAALVEEKQGEKRIEFFEFPLDLPRNSYY